MCMFHLLGTVLVGSFHTIICWNEGIFLASYLLHVWEEVLSYRRIILLCFVKGLAFLLLISNMSKWTISEINRMNLPIIFSITTLNDWFFHFFNSKGIQGVKQNLALIRVRGNLANINISIVHFLVSFFFINGNSKSEVFGEIASNFWVEAGREETQILNNLSLLFLIQVESLLLLRFWKSFPANYRGGHVFLFFLIRVNFFDRFKEFFEEWLAIINLSRVLWEPKQIVDEGTFSTLTFRIYFNYFLGGI